MYNKRKRYKGTVAYFFLKETFRGYEVHSSNATPHLIFKNTKGKFEAYPIEEDLYNGLYDLHSIEVRNYLKENLVEKEDIDEIFEMIKL